MSETPVEYEFKPKPKTVRVRIAVAVDPTGHWSCAGWAKRDSHFSAMEIVVENVEPGEARYWIEADLPIPEEKVVEGEVTRDLTP